jgi:hypothetical protein
MDTYKMALILGEKPGLVVKTEDSGLRGCGFKPPAEENIFQAPFIWVKSLQ